MMRAMIIFAGFTRLRAEQRAAELAASRFIFQHSTIDADFWCKKEVISDFAADAVARLFTPQY